MDILISNLLSESILGKYQNCHLVLIGSFWFFLDLLVLFLVLFSSVFGSLVLIQFFLY